MAELIYGEKKATDINFDISGENLSLSADMKISQIKLKPILDDYIVFGDIGQSDVVASELSVSNLVEYFFGDDNITVDNPNYTNTVYGDAGSSHFTFTSTSVGDASLNNIIYNYGNDTILIKNSLNTHVCGDVGDIIVSTDNLTSNNNLLYNFGADNITIDNTSGSLNVHGDVFSVRLSLNFDSDNNQINLNLGDDSILVKEYGQNVKLHGDAYEVGYSVIDFSSTGNVLNVIFGNDVLTLQGDNTQSGSYTLVGDAHLSGSVSSAVYGDNNTLIYDYGDDILSVSGVKSGFGVVIGDSQLVWSLTGGDGNNVTYLFGNDTFDLTQSLSKSTVLSVMGDVDTLTHSLGGGTGQTITYQFGSETIDLSQISGVSGSELLLSAVYGDANIIELTSVSLSSDQNISSFQFGNDVLIGSDLQEGVFGFPYNDQMIGDVWRLDFNDNPINLSGNDTYEFNFGDDIIQGGLGDDLIVGDAKVFASTLNLLIDKGNTVLADFGNDTLTGGAGNDTFEFSLWDSVLNLNGNDIITDFSNDLAGDNQDTLMIYGAATLAELEAALTVTDSGSDVLISSTLGSGSILLQGVGDGSIDSIQALLDANYVVEFSEIV